MTHLEIACSETQSGHFDEARAHIQNIMDSGVYLGDASDEKNHPELADQTTFLRKKRPS